MLEPPRFTLGAGLKAAYAPLLKSAVTRRATSRPSFVTPVLPFAIEATKPH